MAEPERKSWTDPDPTLVALVRLLARQAAREDAADAADNLKTTAVSDPETDNG